MSGREVSPSLFVWDAVDYSVERNHQFDISILCTKRPPEDTTSSPYWLKPISTDLLLWCDDNGSNEAARLRFRVEYGQTRTLGFTTSGNADTEPLSSHFVSCRSDTGTTDNLRFGSQPPSSDVVEILAFVELVAGGEVAQAKQIITLPARQYVLFGVVSSNLFTFRNLGIRWNAAIKDDALYASGYLIAYGAAGSEAIFPEPNESLAFPHFVFEPQNIVGGIQNNHMARSWGDPPLVTTYASHVAKRKTQLKTPCVSPDLSPYCGEGDYANSPAVWPWKHAGDCNAWKRSGNIAGAPCDSTKTAITLTIPEAYGGSLLGYAMGKLIANSYELSQVADSGDSLIDSSFWFSDTPGTTTVLGDNTYTLSVIEISASISLNGYMSPPPAPCQNSDWPVQVFFNISCVVGNGENNVRLTYGFSATTDLAFFAGNEFEFRPYGNRFFGFDACAQCVRPRVGVWPFFFLSGGSTEEVSYSGEYFPDPLPAPYKVKLI